MQVDGVRGVMEANVFVIVGQVGDAWKEEGRSDLRVLDWRGRGAKEEKNAVPCTYIARD